MANFIEAPFHGRSSRTTHTMLGILLLVLNAGLASCTNALSPIEADAGVNGPDAADARETAPPIDAPDATDAKDASQVPDAMDATTAPDATGTTDAPADTNDANDAMSAVDGTGADARDAQDASASDAGCPPGQHECPCATGSYCLAMGALCIDPTAACP